MIISHKHKFIFIHIPKCAGSSISTSLREYYGYDSPEKLRNADLNDFAMFKIDSIYGNADYLNQHSKYKDIKEYFDNNNFNINDYFKFAFVRNPWDLQVSKFKYLKRLYKENKHTYIEWVKKNGNLSFKEFLMQSDDPQLNYLSEKHIDSQTPKQNKVLVDFIGKHETLQLDFNTICDKIGIPRQELPHENKTEHKHYTKYYDDETREIVAKKFAKDIEYFGYKFGE